MSAPVGLRPVDLPLARLRQAVTELLAAARRGEVEPSVLELSALHVICTEHGAFDSTRAIRQYLLDTTAAEYRETAVRR
jgi:hypothetical protein